MEAPGTLGDQAQEELAGARPFADGVDVIYYIAQENYPVEYVERDFPLRIERYAVRPAWPPPTP